MIHPRSLLEDAAQEVELKRLQGQAHGSRLSQALASLIRTETRQKKLLRAVAPLPPPSALSEPEAAAAVRERYPNAYTGRENGRQVQVPEVREAEGDVAAV